MVTAHTDLFPELTWKGVHYWLVTYMHDHPCSCSMFQDSGERSSWRAQGAEGFAQLQDDKQRGGAAAWAVGEEAACVLVIQALLCIHCVWYNFLLQFNLQMPYHNPILCASHWWCMPVQILICKRGKNTVLVTSELIDFSHTCSINVYILQFVVRYWCMAFWLSKS